MRAPGRQRGRTSVPLSEIDRLGDESASPGVIEPKKQRRGGRE